MIELVDAHITERLQKITYNGDALRVPEYSPDREKLESQYPCVAWERLYWRIDYKRARACCDVWVPGAEEATITVTPVVAMGGETEVTGPTTWTKKPHATPVRMAYELHPLATRKADADELLELTCQCFPPGYQPKITGPSFTIHPLFFYGTIQSLDELDRPLFHKSVMLWVEDVWIERLESEEFASITTITGEVSAVENTNYP